MVSALRLEASICLVIIVLYDHLHFVIRHETYKHALRDYNMHVTSNSKSW